MDKIQKFEETQRKQFGSPYAKRWAIFMPLTPPNLPKDKRVMERFLHRDINTFAADDTGIMWCYYPEDVEAFPRKILGLRGTYKVIFISDKQFSRIVLDYTKREVIIPFTKKQLDDSFIVGSDTYIGRVEYF